MIYECEIEEGLIGKKIKSGKRIDDNHYLFDLEEGPLTLFVEGDCCSHSWIESVEGEDALRDATILSAEKVDVMGTWVSEDGEEAEDEEGTFRRTYFFKIRTDKGYWDMDFRNDSNGYYGAILTLEGSTNE